MFQMGEVATPASEEQRFKDSARTNSSLDVNNAPSERTAALWKRGAKAAGMYAEATTRVAQTNKIGVAPEGWHHDAAMALQQHVAAGGSAGGAGGSGRPPGLWEAPASDLFARARQACGFTPVRYYATLGAQSGQTKPTLRLLGASSAAGRSGAFFFLTPDQQFIVKTCTRKEWMLLLKVLPHYVDHLEGARANLRRRRSESHEEFRHSGTGLSSLIADSGSLQFNNMPVSSSSVEPDNQPDSQRGAVNGLEGFVDTLLPRYLGLYRYQAGDDATPICVVVMTNVFAGAVSIDRRYDLKGSTHGRTASEPERSKKAPVFKDLDWQEAEPPLQLAAPTRDKIMQILENDTAFLTRHGLIDYSLLLGIHDLQGNSGYRPKEGMLVTTVADGSRIAYIGLVDVLTSYAAKKKAETFFLGSLMCGRDISCQPPVQYARRFLRFTGQHVFPKRVESVEEGAAEDKRRV